MRRFFLALAIFFLFPTLVFSADPISTSHVYFSPKGGCTKAMTDAIGQAKQPVLVQAYSFTSYPIAQALIEAGKRGVKVEAIVDGKQIHEKKTK